MNINNNNFNDFRMEDYYSFRRLRAVGLINTRPNVPNSSYKRHSPVDNLKRPIKLNTDPPIFGMVTSLCNETRLITSFNTDNKFIRPAHASMINKDQEKKEGLETSKVSPSDEPNSMDYHSNTLLYPDEGRSKASNTDNTDKIRLVTPKDKFVCHAQVIMTIRDQGR